MKINDDDIKIFHPKKNEGAGADLAQLVALMDEYRRNGNMEKANSLGGRLAGMMPETVCPEEVDRLKNNELFHLRTLMVFASQLALHKYLPHQMLASQAVNALYAKLNETSPGYFANISDGSAFSFYYLAVRSKGEVVENIGKNYAKLCDKDDDSRLISLASRIFTQTDIAVCDMIDEAEFEE